MKNKFVYRGCTIALSLITGIVSFFSTKEADQEKSKFNIAYIAAGNSSRHMAVIDLEGDKDRNFKEPKIPGRYFNATTTTPDGKQIAFMRDVEGIDRYSLWTMQWDGSDLERLTPKGQEALAPSWAADGSKLAFTRRDGGVWEIYMINSDGSGLKRITNFNQEGRRARWGPHTSWSPDGSTIAYSAGFGRSDDYEIYLLDVESGKSKQLTNNDYHDRAPDFSPDGKFLAYNASINNGRETVIHNLQTNNIRSLGNSATAFGLDWSPDGSKIAYTGLSSDNHEIFVMNSDGSNQTRLTNSSGYDISPTWIFTN